jgi:glycosyltransferase involved in cell wall biosynthesis
MTAPKIATMSSPPDISVVMGIFNDVDRLRETMESILSQEGVSLEFIVVNDGSTDGSDVILGDYARRDTRVRIVHQDNQGLTRALITGCQTARGKYIARQDAGDVSLPNRLRLQKAVLDQHEDCVFVSGWTTMIGPKDEYLFMLEGKGRASSPIQILYKREDRWVAIDGPTHHGSVMFRRDAYVKAGGYRAAFYYAQDCDLWYRLATLGTFTMAEQCVYRGRITPTSISASSRDRQVAYARLSHEAIALRLAGRSDAAVVEKAERLRPCKPHVIRRSDKGRAMYFVGKCLLNNNDLRAKGYFSNAIYLNPFLFRAWWSAAICLTAGAPRRSGT